MVISVLSSQVLIKDNTAPTPTTIYSFVDRTTTNLRPEHGDLYLGPVDPLAVHHLLVVEPENNLFLQ